MISETLEVPIGTPLYDLTVVGGVVGITYIQNGMGTSKICSITYDTENPYHKIKTEEGYVSPSDILEGKIIKHPTGLLLPEDLSIKNQIKHFLILPLWSPNDPSKGETCYAEELNWWFTKYKVRTEESNQEYTTHITYIPTRFTTIIAAIAIAIIGIIWYKSKH